TSAASELQLARQFGGCEFKGGSTSSNVPEGTGGSDDRAKSTRHEIGLRIGNRLGAAGFDQFTHEFATGYGFRFGDQDVEIRIGVVTVKRPDWSMQCPGPVGRSIAETEPGCDATFGNQCRGVFLQGVPGGERISTETSSFCGGLVVIEQRGG